MQITSVFKTKLHIFYKKYFGIFNKCCSSPYFPEDTIYATLLDRAPGKVAGEVGSRGAGQPTPPSVKVKVRKVSESLCSVSKVENEDFYMYRKFYFYF